MGGYIHGLSMCQNLIWRVWWAETSLYCPPYTNTQMQRERERDSTCHYFFALANKPWQQRPYLPGVSLPSSARWIRSGR